MDFCIRPREVFDRLTLKLVVVFVADAHKVIARARKLFHKIGTMRHASAKDNGFSRTTKHFMRLLDPLLDYVSRDFDAALLNLVGTPLTTDLLCPTHVDFFGDKHFEGCKPLVIHKEVCRRTHNDIGINLAKAFGKWGCRQADDL